MAAQEKQQQVGESFREFVAAGTVDLEFEGGLVRVIFTSLPGRTVVVGMRDDNGVLWIALDDGKAWARGHLAELLADEYVTCCDDLYVTSEMRKIPTRGTRGRCHLELVP